MSRNYPIMQLSKTMDGRTLNQNEGRSTSPKKDEYLYNNELLNNGGHTHRHAGAVQKLGRATQCDLLTCPYVQVM